AHAEIEDYWDSVLWSDDTKINVSGNNGFKTVWLHKGEEYKEKCMVPRVKHGGGRVLHAGVGELHFFEGIMNSMLYIELEVFQHDNHPKHTSKATVAFL
ncbi:unnamed protein product, partial [Staurois parvus]